MNHRVMRAERTVFGLPLRELPANHEVLQASYAAANDAATAHVPSWPAGLAGASAHL